MQIRWVTVGPFQENAYLLTDEREGMCVLIDPGDEPARLITMVRQSGAALQAIWLTHAHIDHIGGIAGVLREWTVPVFLHPADRPLWDAAPQQAAWYGIRFDPASAPDHSLQEGDRLTVGGVEVSVWHTPGHAPGHCVLVGSGFVLGGDLLFAGSIGRTDLPLADPVAMERSLERIATLPEVTVVYPGHGPVTTIGAERQGNPFLSGIARVPKGTVV